jgi:sugar O-acyltransferase (sialic acid O-acetyltransferase NeuD family)
LEKLIIYGNKSVARGAYSGFRRNPKYEVVAFTVDREYLEGDRFCQLPIVPFETVSKEFPPETHSMFIAVGYVGNNRIRKERYLRSKEMGYRLVSSTSATAIVSPESTIGENCVIGHFVVISDNVRIGNNVFISTACTIGHDVVIGDHCLLSDGVSVGGSVNIGSCSYLGMRSIIRNRVSIGNDCVIGAGALMLEDAEDGCVYMGEPATLLPISSEKLPLG